MYSQRICQLERSPISGKLARTVTHGHSGPASEQNIQEAALLGSGQTDFTVREVHFDRSALQIGRHMIVPFAVLIDGLDDLVMADYLLIAKTYSPSTPPFEFVMAESRLDPPVELTDAIWMHAHRREHLEDLGTIR